jgi:Na+/H+ antiporter NhaD/arsenite permease-like protein
MVATLKLIAEAAPVAGIEPHIKWMAVAIFALTYLVIGIGRMPPLRIDRAGAALLGAALMVGCGVLSLSDAYQAIDFDTITLLLGMMIVVANLRLSGFFGVINNWAVTRARHPLLLLGTVVLVSGAFSAFLVNDTICIVLTPLVFELVSRLGRNPVPYLLAVAMASNIGSTATITGNPQNIIIGSLSHIAYGHFASVLAPVAAFGLVLTVGLIAVFFPAEFWTRERLQGEALRVRVNGPLMWKAVLVTVAMVIAFFLGQPVAKVAVLAGSLLLLTRRLKPGKVYREIDWSLLVMFSGLFIVVSALEKSVLDQHVMDQVKALHLEQTWILSTVTAVLSNLVSNVPAVLVLKPFIAQLADQQRGWLVVAMSSTLAGNFTILGSIANLIVVQRARAHSVEISFWDYFKVGAPLTILTILIGILWV